MCIYCKKIGNTVSYSTGFVSHMMSEVKEMKGQDDSQVSDLVTHLAIPTIKKKKKVSV